jgi:chemotaxis response regulator CheB
VIVGKTVPADRQASCLGYVQTYDTKPERRVFEARACHGMQANRQVTVLTDGGDEIRDIPSHLNPQSPAPVGLVPHRDAHHRADPASQGAPRPGYPQLSQRTCKG